MTGRFKSKFRMTVTQDLYDAVAEKCGPPFADSFLYGATRVGDKLTARTVTGYGLMKDSGDFMALLKDLNLTLVKPWPFHLSGSHHTAEDCR